MTQEDTNQLQRRSIRLQSWDYTNAGAYFLTIVTHERRPLFGTVNEGEMVRSPYGEIVHEEWLASAEIRREVELDTFVIMPNHLHGVVWLASESPLTQATQSPQLHNDAPHGAPRSFQRPAVRSIGAFVAGFKAAVTKRINVERGTPGAVVWQRNYYERVIRNERELDAIRLYIEANPEQWVKDPENPGGQ